jgi:hypothetical protein
MRSYVHGTYKMFRIEMTMHLKENAAGYSSDLRLLSVRLDSSSMS